VVFENIHRNAAGRPAGIFSECVSRLVGRGHTVVVESWAADAPWLARVPRHSVVRLGPDWLPRLAEGEIAEWGRRILDRPLTASEADALELFAGHPRKLRGALERFRVTRSVAASGDDDVESEVLEVALQWEELESEFDEFVHSRSARSALSPLTESLSVWLGAMPWAGMPAELLEQPDRESLRRLSLIRMVHQVPGSDTWRGGAWARIFALRRLTAKPSLPAAHEGLLESLVDRIGTEDVDRQRRHLCVLAAELADSREALLHLADALEHPAAAEEEDGARTYYVAPPPPDVTTAIALPSSPDLNLWLAEGAARNRQPEAVRKLVERLADTERDTVSGLLASDWRAVKSLHTALVRVPLSDSGRSELYELLAPAPPRPSLLS